MSENEQEYVKTTFDTVASKYDEIELFKTSARHVVELIKKHTRNKPNLTVLDVACGTGNVVLECASCLDDAVCDAIDISEGMLAKAKENASVKNLDNIDFHLQDITKLELKKKYNVITCSYALFFLPDAPKVLASLYAMLKPRGIVIFTSFTVEAFSPSDEILIPLLRKYGSKSALEYHSDKWENLKQKKDIERLCAMSRVSDMKMYTKEIRYGMSVDEWWNLLNNTSYKGMLMELSEDDYADVKNEYYTSMYTHADMDGEVELIADTYFVVVN